MTKVNSAFTLISALLLATSTVASHAQKSHGFLKHEAKNTQVVETDAPFTEHLLTQASSIPLLINGEIKFYNTGFLSQQISQAASSVFPSESPRVAASIRTDQSFYKPGQIIQVEVLLFNAMTKVPITI